MNRISFTFLSQSRQLLDISILGKKASPVAGGLIITAVGGALWWFLAFRLSPPDQAGYFVAVLGIGTLVAEAANLGTGYVLLRYYPKNGEFNVILARTGITMVTGAIFLLVSSLGFVSALRFIHLPFPAPLGSWVLLLITVLGIAWYSLTDSLLLASGKRWGLFIRSTAMTSGRLVLLVAIAAMARLSLFTLIVAYTLPFVIGSIVYFYLYRQDILSGVKSKLFLDRSQIGRFAPYAIRSHVGNVIGAVTPNAMPALIVWGLGPVAGAQYGAMWSIAGLVMLVPTAVSLTSLSIVARGESSEEQMVPHGNWLIFLSTLPVILLILLSARIVLPYLGEAYNDIHSWHLAPLLLSNLCLGLIAQFYSRARLSDRGLRLIIAGQSVQMITVLIFACLLIRPWGLAGVSIAWLLGNTATLLFLRIKHNYSYKPIDLAEPLAK